MLKLPSAEDAISLLYFEDLPDYGLNDEPTPHNPLDYLRFNKYIDSDPKTLEDIVGLFKGENAQEGYRLFWTRMDEDINKPFEAAATGLEYGLDKRYVALTVLSGIVGLLDDYDFGDKSLQDILAIVKSKLTGGLEMLTPSGKTWMEEETLEAGLKEFDEYFAELENIHLMDESNYQLYFELTEKYRGNIVMSYVAKLFIEDGTLTAEGLIDQAEVEVIRLRKVGKTDTSRFRILTKLSLTAEPKVAEWLTDIEEDRRYTPCLQKFFSGGIYNDIVMKGAFKDA